MKKTFNDEDRQRLINKKVVSNANNVIWLINYWTGKDIKGLIVMLLSCHWVMNIEAANKIIEK